MKKLSDWLKTGYIVEIDDENEQICIIPSGGGIPTDHFLAVTKMVGEMGYKWWIPADHRKGFIFSKLNLSVKDLNK